MAITGKKGHAAKPPTKSKNSTGKVKTKRGIDHTKAPSRATRKTTSRTPRQQNSDATYIFECTRLGCGYRIPREERAEQGSIRFDLKCPKCHNREFKCLGKGFNVYVAGPPITGKRPAARSFLENIAKTRPVPPDWVYVNNFQNPYEPKTLKLPSGRAKVFQKDMKNLVDQAKRAVPAALQNEEFVSRGNTITKKAVAERNKILSDLNKQAEV